MTESNDLTRRAFIYTATRAGLGGSVLLSVGCATGPTRTSPDKALLALPFAQSPGKVAVNVSRNKTMRDLCEASVPAITDMNWLQRGDAVLIKIACNSGKPHPSVTSPDAVEALVAFLKERGAGKVLVGDQSGVAYVRRTQQGKVRSSRQLMEQNGLLKAIKRSGAEPRFFDDSGWGGYFRAKIDFDGHWGDDLWLANAVNEVDHIVNLARLSTHVLAGYSAGIKIAVGWLRDDSRMVLHRDGDRFFERVAEISHVHALRSKLRFTLTMGDHALLNAGPDYGSPYAFEWPHAIASTNLIDHDSLVAAMLPWLDRDDASIFDLYSVYPDHAGLLNQMFVRKTWGSEAAAQHTPIVPPEDTTALAWDTCRAHLSKLTNYRPRRIEVVGDMSGFPDGLVAHLKTLDGGVLAL